VVIIGIDPHKRTHTASALDPDSHRVVASLQVQASLAGYRQLQRWAARFASRRWAVENARGLGRHLAQWLIARGEQVHDVPCTATARVRELSRGGRRKNDVIDAAASVAALSGDARPVAGEDASTALALLDERRTNLVAQRTRLVNQLHALLRDLVPGGADTDLTPAHATRVLPGFAAEITRKLVARELVGEIRDIDARLKKLTALIAEKVAEHGSRLPQVDGIGPVIAARLLGRTGRADRFASSSAFASYAGVAPVEVASGQQARHRLPRGGDRQLNYALHIVALTQVRMRASTGRGYYDRKISEGKTHNEAMRCLKRRLADHVWRVMTADERDRARRVREDNRGRLWHPARPAQPRSPALRTSHFPDPPAKRLRPPIQRLDKHRGTPACPETRSSSRSTGRLSRLVCAARHWSPAANPMRSGGSRLG
jgi:transposase